MTDLADLEAPPEEDGLPLPPQDIHAEVCTLGGMLLSRAAITDVADTLTGPDFYRPAHELIFDAIAALDEAGEPADAITVADHLERTGNLGRVGGQAYLHQIVTATPTAANAGYYADIVAERATLRRLAAAGTRIVQMAHGDGDRDVDEMVDIARAEVDAAANGRDSIVDPEADLEAAIAALEDDTAGIPTPWAELNRILAGWRPGDLYYVGARPGTGKSLVGIGAALDVAYRGKHAAVFSLEMSKVELYHRMLSQIGSVSATHILRRQLTDDDWTRVAKAADKIRELVPAMLTVDDTAEITPAHIRSICRTLSRRHDLGLVVVDYLQLMTSGRKSESRQQEVTSMSRALKLLAKELRVPVLVLSQLNRSSEHRTDRRPTMADLRESGSLEQDATAVLLLHRDVEAAPDVLEVNIPKHRHGVSNVTVKLGWEAHYSRIGDLHSWQPSGFGRGAAS